MGDTKLDKHIYSVSRNHPESIVSLKPVDFANKPLGDGLYECNRCGKAFRPKSRGGKDGSYKYCSRACANAPHRFVPIELKEASRYMERCRVCGSWFLPAKPGSGVCGDSCRKIEARARTLIRDKLQRDKRAMQCKVCGKTFLYEYGTKVRAFCSPQCSAEGAKQQHQISKRSRRHAIRIHRVEHVSLLKMLEQQRWTCPLCNQKISKEIKYPDMMAPSIDHIVPVSLGGEHSYANCQAVHLACNIMKGAKPVMDYTGQMALC